MNDKSIQQPCPAPPMPPAAGSMTGHWQCPAGSDWRPIPSTTPVREKAKRPVIEPEGQPEFVDRHGQAHRAGQRLFR